MNVDIEIEEGDNLGHVLNEVARQVTKESDADVVTLQLALPPTKSLRGTPFGDGAAVRALRFEM